MKEAEPFFRQALDVAGQGEEAWSGAPVHLTTINDLALLLEAQGRLEEAEPLFRQALEGREKKPGASTQTPSRASTTWLASPVLRCGLCAAV